LSTSWPDGRAPGARAASHFPDAKRDASASALTLGVVGHVDHGKTALVRALTGIETDRLKEERERGLSIVLGFSYLETPNGIIDLIDAPGHEDFIRAMISGATGLDGIVLVVAANEGIMPQTKEHFDIARLLDVGRGLIVINKSDLVSAAEIEELQRDLQMFVAGTFLENAPIISASAVTRRGIDELASAFDALCAVPIERPAAAGFYMPLDRIFTVKGFGVVATGTLRGAPLAINDAVEIMPSGRHASVRALQNHQRAVDRGFPGQRIAVNLRNVNRSDLERGNVIGTPGLVTPTRRVDAEIRLLEDAAPLQNAATARLLIGTTEAIVKIRMLGARELAAGSTGYAQLRCDRDIATLRGERFILRSYSPMRTVGGGRILDPTPARHARFDTAVTTRLAAAAAGEPAAIARQALNDAGSQGLVIETAARQLGIEATELEKLAESGEAVRVSHAHLASAAAVAAVREAVVAELGRYHEMHPHRQGMPVSSLETTLESAPHRDVLAHAVRELAASSTILTEGDSLRLADFDPLARLSEAERRAADDVEQAFRESALVPLPVERVIGASKSRQHLYRLLLEYGRLVRLKTYDRNAELVLHSYAVDEAKRKIAERFPLPSTFTVSEARDVLGSTRKYVVPLMEHFDATGFTVRRGDHRQLRAP
jgi:selenocysteine-specific elongation factor